MESSVEDLLVALAGVVVLGIATQWIAWRLRVPAIPLLLLAGFAAGSLTGFLDPDALLGDLLFPIVSLSVAIILFEGGLSLNVAELREIGGVVRNLVTVGALVTWAASAALAYLLLDLDIGIAVLLGAILIVTGPTVIVPMLRHIRPSPRIGSTVKWEGIVNDPIGAILAVLVFEVIVSGGLGRGAEVAAIGIVKVTVAGGLFGLLGAGLIVLLLKQYWIPDFLQSPATLSAVLAVFTGSNLVHSESGLLAVTVMGSALASQKLVTVRHIIEFKENLRVLLISVLFIILAARLPLTDPAYTNPGSLLFFAALIILVRPAAVALSTWRSILTWRERVFLGLIAPRGIVAAAVASLFSLELGKLGYPGADKLAPIMFLLIVGTVAVYGIAAGPAARWLKVASPNPQGTLLVGASPWVRAVAQSLQKQNVKVRLVDSNWTNVAAARHAGLEANYANVLSERVIDELQLDGLGRLLALTPNDEVNALAALHFAEVFGRSNVFQLAPEQPERGTKATSLPRHLRGRLLFAADATYAKIAARYEAGAVVKQTPLTEEFDYNKFRSHYGEAALPLFAIRDSREVVVFVSASPATPKPGQTLISLVDQYPSE